MKMTAQIQLKPTDDQHKLLKVTLERANAACNAISEYAWANKEFSQYPLHAAMYKQVRVDFELTAHLVVRCLSNVAVAYKLGNRARRQFNEPCAIYYDS